MLAGEDRSLGGLGQYEHRSLNTHPCTGSQCTLDENQGIGYNLKAMAGSVPGGHLHCLILSGCLPLQLHCRSQRLDSSEEIVCALLGTGISDWNLLVSVM